MKSRLLALFLVSILILVLIVSGCGGSNTVTITSPGRTVTAPGSIVTVTSAGAVVTLTAPGSVTTLPAVTVTLPGSVTTIPVTIVSIPPVSTTFPPEDTSLAGFLPTTPITITTHKLLAGDLVGSCLLCHGPGEWYNMFPLPPLWDANDHGSSHRSGVYYVIPGSIQDHTGRDDDACLTCHKVAG